MMCNGQMWHMIRLSGSLPWWPFSFDLFFESTLCSRRVSTSILCVHSCPRASGIPSRSHRRRGIWTMGRGRCFDVICWGGLWWGVTPTMWCDVMAMIVWCWLLVGILLIAPLYIIAICNPFYSLIQTVNISSLTIPTKFQIISSK
jgi:hypothetical protein